MSYSNKIYSFTIIGQVVPYTRMTQRSKYVSKQAVRYLEWMEDFGWNVKQIMMDEGWRIIPSPCPIRIEITYRLPGDRVLKSDLSNIVKGIEDAIQGIVFENDSAVEEIQAKREYGHAMHSIVLQVIRLDGEGHS